MLIRVIQSMTSSLHSIVFLYMDDDNKKNGLFDFIQIFLSLLLKMIHLNALPFVSFGSLFALKCHKTFLLHSELNVKLNYLLMQGLFKDLHFILKAKLCEKCKELSLISSTVAPCFVFNTKKLPVKLSV